MKTGCDDCRVSLVEAAAEGLVKAMAPRIAAGFECKKCGTVWAMVIRPLEGDQREETLALIRSD